MCFSISAVISESLRPWVFSSPFSVWLDVGCTRCYMHLSCGAQPNCALESSRELLDLLMPCQLSKQLTEPLEGWDQASVFVRLPVGLQCAAMAKQELCKGRESALLNTASPEPLVVLGSEWLLRNWHCLLSASPHGCQNFQQHDSKPSPKPVPLPLSLSESTPPSI
jgi:hypothetical protein